MSEKFVRVFSRKDRADYQLGRNSMRIDVQEILETERQDLERRLTELNDNPPDHLTDLAVQQAYRDDTLRLEAQSEQLLIIAKSVIELAGIPENR